MPTIKYPVNLGLQEIGPSEPAITSVHARENIITINNATFVSAREGTPVLRDINLEVPRGTLTMIVGGVGSGKSALLKAILGELSSSKGFVFANSYSTAFSSQTAWLPNSTLREIVLSISDYDEPWYNTVLGASMLNHDITTLTSGEDTVIGSDGVALSGGQKQRLVSIFSTMLMRTRYPSLERILMRTVFGTSSLF